jgi:hypothetical protein
MLVSRKNIFHEITSVALPVLILLGKQPNKKTGAMTLGVKLINKLGNQYIGVY